MCFISCFISIEKDFNKNIQRIPAICETDPSASPAWQGEKSRCDGAWCFRRCVSTCEMRRAFRKRRKYDTKKKYLKNIFFIFFWYKWKHFLMIHIFSCFTFTTFTLPSYFHIFIFSYFCFSLSYCIPMLGNTWQHLAIVKQWNIHMTTTRSESDESDESHLYELSQRDGDFCSVGATWDFGAGTADISEISCVTRRERPEGIFKLSDWSWIWWINVNYVNYVNCSQNMSKQGPGRKTRAERVSLKVERMGFRAAQSQDVLARLRLTWNGGTCRTCRTWDWAPNSIMTQLRLELHTALHDRLSHLRCAIFHSFANGSLAHAIPI